MDVSDCDKLGLGIVQPTLEQLLEVGEKRGKLADDDWLCITNDKALRVECAAVGVEVQWGLEPMLTLAARGELKTDEAESVAWAIHENNPAFVTKAIVNEFKSKLRRLAPPSGV